MPIVQKLPDLTSTTSLFIRTDWDGFFDSAPVRAHYDLKRVGEGFEGEASFSAAGGKRHAVEQVAIPEAEAQKFLEMLSAVSFEPGDYTPDIPGTDNYPEIGMTLQGHGWVVEFFTASQRSPYDPWRLIVHQAGQQSTFVINNGGPTNAMETLLSWLKRDRLAEVIDDQNVFGLVPP